MRNFEKYKIRKFDEYEMDLLHTLQMTNLNYSHDDSFYTVNFILNGEKYKCVNKNKTMHVTVSKNKTMHVTVSKNKTMHCDDLFQQSAFMAKMTLDEFHNFFTNLVLIFKRIHCNLYYSQRPEGLECLTVNIANILLCSINEQYDQNATYENMSKADLVFYDVFLLKCITRIK
jgi:hypothetical protein